MQGSSFRLVVRRGPRPNEVYELTKSQISLGRDITNDIVINDPEVSRQHVKLVQGGGGYTIEDLGSTNGTFINSQRLTGAQPLSHGDTVGLGETVTLVYESAAASGYGAQQGATMVGGGGSEREYAPQAGYQQAPGQQVGYQQQPGVAQPQYRSAQQPGMQPQQPMGYEYDYQDEPYEGGGAARYIILGCGCFLVLCIVASVIGGIIIDATCSWDDIPVISETFDLGVREDATCR